MAAVNGFNSIAPLTLPLAAITAEAVPLQRQFTQEDLYSQVNNGGQILDKLFFSTAYAYTREVTSGMSVNAETLTNTDYQEIYSGGTAISTTITNSGRQAIYSGGTATSTMINSAGQFLSGGTAISTSLESGSYQFVGSSSTASSTVIHSGAIQAVSSGLATSTSILNGGVQEIYSFGSATSTTIGNGGTQIVDSEGSTTLTIINNGGTQEINTGGNGNITTINSGGIQNVNDGGKATATLINNGGIQNVQSSGTATSTTINSGGLQKISGGLAVSTDILNGGTQSIIGFGSATSTTIQSGGVQAVNADGSASSTTINNSGKQYVNYYGRATSTTINSGGAQDVNWAGNAASTTINSGGTQIINSGGTASQSIINQGGVQIVTQFGNVTSTTINNGGIQYLENNAEADSNIVGSGGTVALRSEGNAWLYDMQINGGTIRLATTGTIGNNITLSNPQGSANFVINTDLANNQSDHITIEGGSTTNTVKVNYDPNFGQGSTISGSARFATVTDEATTFTGVATDSGAYRYTPILSSVLVSSGDNGAEDFSIQSVREDHVEWYITGLSSGGASETMYTAHDAVANTLTLWRDENNHLIRRMGDLRTGSGQTGDWARIYSGEQESNSSNGRHTTQKYTALQGGHDTKHVSDSGTRFTGYAIGYLNADATMERGTGDASSISLGAYSSWFGNKGHFLDLILKQGRLRNSFTSYLENADNTWVDASYNNWGTSLSAEYGLRKPLHNQWYLEPQAEITFNRITSADFTASDGTSVSQGGLNSVIGRLGVIVGKTVKQNSFYLQASLLREFNAHSDVTMSSGGLTPVTMREDLKETYMEFALGITTAFNDKTSGYFEASKTTGDKVRTPWLLNAGFRRSF